MNTQTTSAVIKAFDAVYNELVVIPSCNEWNNGTGYFDGAVKGEHAPKLKKGERVASISTDGRRLIIMGTQLGENIIVFERYTDNKEVFCIHRPTEYKFLVNDGRVNVDDMHYVIGWTANRPSGLIGAIDFTILEGFIALYGAEKGTELYNNAPNK